MKRRVLVIGLALMPIALMGCSQSKSSSSSWWFGQKQKPSHQTAVAVRFAMPPWPDQFPDGAYNYEAYSWQWNEMENTAAESGYNKVGSQAALTSSGFAGPQAGAASPYHVALWGGPWGGHNVTYAVTALTPGDYSFAFIDQGQPAAAQGSIHVNLGSNTLLDMLTKWKKDIPEQKKWFAYEYEIRGRLKGGDEQAFQSWAKQMRAFDRLERRIEQAIRQEQSVVARQQSQYNSFLASTEVLMLPGAQGVFRPTTEPAFSQQELAKLWKGQSLSKMLLVADYEPTKWKMDHVNQVYNDFARCKSVLMEEADRLQRRKRFYTLTDHIYNHDRKFVLNEMRLQLTYTAIDQLNERMAELRERRLGLAFTNELFAPDASWKWLSLEQQSLQREKVVLETQKRQLDLLFEQSEETSPQRLAFERNRQQVVGAIERINQEIEQLHGARTALTSLKNNSQIIHRAGDFKMMAASFMTPDIPFSIRDALQWESVMTVRLDKADNFFAPGQVYEATMQKVSSPVYPFQK
jgi:hypothetical protein